MKCERKTPYNIGLAKCGQKCKTEHLCFLAANAVSIDFFS